MSGIISNRLNAKLKSLLVPVHGQVGEAGDAKALREPARDSSLHDVGREEGQRECRLHMPFAAMFAGCNGVDAEIVFENVFQPTAARGDREDDLAAWLSPHRA